MGDDAKAWFARHIQSSTSLTEGDCGHRQSDGHHKTSEKPLVCKMQTLYRHHDIEAQWIQMVMMIHKRIARVQSQKNRANRKKRTLIPLISQVR